MMHTTKENENCIEHEYVIEDKVLIINEGMGHKDRDNHIETFTIIQIHTNGTVKIPGISIRVAVLFVESC